MTPLQHLIAALRSGQYSQMIGRLRRNDEFCCLGVACDVMRREIGKGEWVAARDERFGRSADRNFVITYSDHMDEGEIDMAIPVGKWFGLRYGFGNFEICDADGHFMTMASGLNDEAGLTFAQIADVLEWNNHALITNYSRG